MCSPTLLLLTKALRRASDRVLAMTDDIHPHRRRVLGASIAVLTMAGMSIIGRAHVMTPATFGRIASRFKMYVARAAGVRHYA